MTNWAGGGATYAAYNAVGAVVVLPVLRHLTSNKDALIAGLLAGPLGMLPAVLFFVCMTAFYPDIANATLPSDYMLTRLDAPAFHFVFQLMILAALLESGTGMVHAINERVAGVLRVPRPRALDGDEALDFGRHAGHFDLRGDPLWPGHADCPRVSRAGVCVSRGLRGPRPHLWPVVLPSQRTPRPSTLNEVVRSMIDLASFPRVRLAHLPTPFEPMDRVSKNLGGPRLWIKRDDCTGVSTGGNKVRKLEFVLADAVAKGADTVVTAGAWQSNHSRQTAAAAARLGLECHLLLWNMTGFGERAYRRNGNILLDRLHDATIHELGGPDQEDVLTYLNAEVDRHAQRLRQQGARPYAIPVGASNPLGALGYVGCAREIVAQARDLGLKIDAIVHSSGSAGTQAGLVAGLALSDVRIPVIGIGGGKAPEELEELVFKWRARPPRCSESPWPSSEARSSRSTRIPSSTVT